MTSLRLFARLARLCLVMPMRIVLAVVCLACLGAAQLALPWIIKRWVEGPLTLGEATGYRWLFAALAVASLLAVFLFLSRYLLADINQRLVESLRKKAVGRILEQEPRGLGPYPTGDLMARVLQDAGLLSGFAELLLKRLIGDGFLALGALTMMFVLNPRLAAIGCVLAPGIALVMTAVGSIIRHWGQVAQREMGSLSSTLQEQLQGFTTIKGYRTEKYEAGRFAAHNAGYRDKVVRAQTWSALLIATVFLLATMSFVAAIAYGTNQVTAGTLSAGGLLAFCLYAGQTIEPLRRLAEFHGLMQRSLAAAERLFAIFDLPAAEEPVTKDTNPRARGGAAIRFENVHFAYQIEHPVLNGFTARIDAGEQVAIVGESGSGKSTIAALLVRFHDVGGGHITLNGSCLDNWDVPTLRRWVRVVEQKPFVFKGSLIDNVRYGTWNASPTAIEMAMQLTGLTSIVGNDPDGRTNNIAEAGRDLSGGQQQRVALARAVVSDPAVLVLDEATSALDSESEGHILRALEPWFTRRTVIAMAHRLSTIQRFKRIILLRDGQVAADGHFEQLLRESPDFGRLFADQIGCLEADDDASATTGEGPA